MSEKKLKKMKLPDDAVQAQWELFADEYNIPGDEDLTGSDPTTQALKQLKGAWLRMIKAGLVEVVSDPNEGIVVKQFLAHHVEGVSGEPQCLVYHAPTVSIISQTRMGTESGKEMPSAQKYLKYTAAATNVAESILYQLKGGDQTRMGEVAQLFLIV